MQTQYQNLFCINPDYLDELVNKYHEDYATAQPFPHIVMDDFLPEFVLDKVLAEFPTPGSADWRKFDNVSEKKLASTSELQMGEMTRLLLYQLNSSTFISFLERLTGIDGIIPDPHFVGGGLHQIEPGGYLKVHADFNRHQHLRLDRRLNLLLYLNKNWQEEYGGHLELWDTQMTSCKKKILPIFNRCVIFSTTDFSYHGHPTPLTCPPGNTRKSLALYYYTNGRPAEEIGNSHSTIFRSRPGEDLRENVPLNQNWKTLAKKLIPPIFLEIKDSLGKKN